ncbi:MAG: hypothetical protein P8Y27_04135 [Chromatiaceae bacterium]
MLDADRLVLVTVQVIAGRHLDIGGGITQVADPRVAKSSQTEPERLTRRDGDLVVDGVETDLTEPPGERLRDRVALGPAQIQGLGDQHGGGGVGFDRRPLEVRGEQGQQLQTPGDVLVVEDLGGEQEEQRRAPLGDLPARAEDLLEGRAVVAGAGDALGGQELLEAQVIEGRARLGARQQQARAGQELLALDGGLSTRPAS